MKSFLLFCLSIFALSFSAIAGNIIYDGGNLSYFEDDGAWEPIDFSDEFEYRELVYIGEEHALDYKVMPKQDNLVHDLLYWRPDGMTAAQKIVFRMRNLGMADVTLSAGWTTMREGVPGTTRWYGWNYKGDQVLPADGQWHDVVFDGTPENIDTHEGNDLADFPVYKPFGRLNLVFLGTPKGVETHIQLKEIRGEDDVVSTGTIRWTGDFPAEMTAGDEVDLPGFTVDFQGRAPLDTQTRLVFRPLFKDDSWPELPIVLEGVEQSGMTWTLAPQALPLTQFLLDGDYRVTLECGEAELENGSFQVRIHGRKDVGFRKMSVESFGGRPTIHRDGQPMTGAMRATYSTEGPRGIRSFSECGIKIFGFCSTPTEGGYNLEMLTEYAPGKYNYQQFDRRMRNTLAVNPDAMLIVRLFLHAPRWWAQEHPEDMVWIEKVDDPTAQKKLFVWNQGRAVPSWASPAWREYTKEGLRQLMAYLKASPYADHIAGFVLASGCTEEWMEWGFTSGVVADYSPASENAFRQWLRRKYSTDQALQVAWGEDAVTLETATQPSAYERAVSDFPGFLNADAPNARRIADYNRYHSENVSGCIAEFCQTIKEATDNHLLAGAFYGYFAELSGDLRLVTSGHLGVGNILANPNVDYLCSPTGYNYRQVGGDGMSYCMGAGDSLQLHNKFWFIENDIRTSATPNSGHGCPENVWGDVLQQTKESMHNLLTGMAQWWFDVGYVRFVDKEVYQAIRDCVGVMDAATLEYGRVPVAQVALILDEASMDWVTQPTAQTGHICKGFQRTICTLGAPYEVYLAQDLPNLPERIRLLFLPLSLTWTPEQAAALQKFQADGRVVVFIGTPGIIPPQGSGMSREESALAFTGLPLKFGSTTTTALCQTDAPDGEWLSRGALGQNFFNGAWKESPTSNVHAYLEEGDGVRILAHYLDRATGKATSQGAICLRETPQSTVLFCGVSNFPREVLESAYEKAGVHRYLDTPDQVWATEKIFAVCVQDGGVKMLRLPRACSGVRDMISGESYPVDAEGVTCVDFLPRQTKVFLLEE